MAIIKETVILAPKEVINKAKHLKGIGLNESALQMLQDNKIEFDVYSEKDIPYSINVRVSSKLTNLSSFQNRIREEKKERWKNNESRAKNNVRNSF